jgi:hypothetical protein
MNNTVRASYSAVPFMFTVAPRIRVEGGELGLRVESRGFRVQG